MELSTNTRTLIIGTVVGGFLGLGAAYLMVRRSEESGEEISFDASKGLRAALLVLTMMRGVNELAAPN